MATIRERLQEAAIAMFGDLITFGLLRKKEGKPEKPEGAESVIKTLAPHIFGLGPEDEAIFNAALAKLDYGMNVDIARFLQKLSAREQARFILSVAVMPNETDRLNVLKMYANALPKEMALLAKSGRMIGDDTLKHLTDMAETYLGKSGVKDFVKTIDKNAGEFAKKIKTANEEFSQHRKEREDKHPKLFKLLSYK